MDFDILLEQLGEDGVYALSNGLYSQMEDDQRAVVNSLSYGAVASIKAIEEAISNLADLLALRLQYDELAAALDNYAIPKEKEE